MDERSLLFVGIIIVVVTGALVWSSNRTTDRTDTRQQSRRSSLPPVRVSTTNARSAKRPTASPPQDFDTAPPDSAASQSSQPRSHPPHPKSVQPASSVTTSLEEQQSYRALLTKVQRDHGTAERLIAYERERNPKGTRLDWLRDANERWVRDNR